MFIETSKRSDEVEIMDDFSIDGAILRNTLDTLDVINKWLGGINVTISGLKKVFKKQCKEKEYTIIDLGCGSGAMLRQIADFGDKNGFKFHLIGLDANLHTVEYARELSECYTNITYFHSDIFAYEFDSVQFDIVTSTLFLHHFDQKQLIYLLSQLLKKASIGIIVNDLHRHAVAYYLFKILTIPISNQMVVEDGLTSVRKGFKRKDLEVLSQKINAKADISWKWAFRYLWIITKST